ncbi:MAG: hypothetical protein CME30_02335 [Gemmatimonadetes bacterium]|nr:hypothetical protein [Gemmatimonadota bacterium]
MKPQNNGHLGLESAKYLGHGMTFAVSAALFGWIGNKIGIRIGAEALMTTVGVFLGFGGAFYRLYTTLNADHSEKE